MFCRNCGKQMGEQDKFCFTCGSNASGPISNNPSPIIHNNSSSTVYGNQDAASYGVIGDLKPGIRTSKLLAILMSIGAMLLNIIIFFVPWISIPALRLSRIFDWRVQYEFTLFQLYSLASQADDIIGSDGTAGFKLGLLLIMIIAFVAIGFLIRFGFILFTKFEHSDTACKSAFNLCIITSIIIYLVVFLVNKKYGIESSGVLETSVGIFIMLFNSIVAIIKIPSMIVRERNSQYGSSYFSKPRSILAKVFTNDNTPSKPSNSNKIECDKCGKVYESRLSSCPKCGYRMY